MKNRTSEGKWALIFVGATLLWMVLEKAVGLHGPHIDQHPIHTNLFALIAIAVYVFALREKKKKSFGGQVTYREGFLSGLIMTGIITIVSPLTQIIIHRLISPEYFTNARAYAVETGLLTEEVAEKTFNLNNYLAKSTLGTLIMGIITTAVVVLFLRSHSGRADRPA